MLIITTTRKWHTNSWKYVNFFFHFRTSRVKTSKTLWWNLIFSTTFLPVAKQASNDSLKSSDETVGNSQFSQRFFWFLFFRKLKERTNVKYGLQMDKKWNNYHLHSKVLRTTPYRQKPQIPGKDRTPQMGILSDFKTLWMSRKLWIIKEFL